MNEVQLIYNTSFFKSLATGGNVSQALVNIFMFSLGCVGLVVGGFGTVVGHSTADREVLVRILHWPKEKMSGHKK